MKKVYLQPSETVVNSEYLKRMEDRAQAEEGYRRATQYMQGYLAETRRALQAARLEKNEVTIARMKGRLEAVTAFDRAVVEFTAEA